MQLSASQPIWTIPAEAVPAALQTTLQGLSDSEAQRRRPLLLRFVDQLVHFMALLLWVAGALAFAAGTPQLGWAIWAVVLVNGLFSFWQDYQAERTVAALKRSIPRQVRLWRNGELTELDAELLVPGDRILLEEGDQVPADARLIEANELSLDLSVLTGESQPVARHADAIDSSAADKVVLIPSRERANLVLAGTSALEQQVGHIVRTLTCNRMAVEEIWLPQAGKPPGVDRGAEAELLLAAQERDLGLEVWQQHHPQADPVRVIQGDQLEMISDVQLRQLLKYRNRLVFARMAPSVKWLQSLAMESTMPQPCGRPMWCC